MGKHGRSKKPAKGTNRLHFLGVRSTIKKAGEQKNKNAMALDAVVAEVNRTAELAKFPGRDLITAERLREIDTLSLGKV
jgi:hypothetical protein